MLAAPLINIAWAYILHFPTGLLLNLGNSVHLSLTEIQTNNRIESGPGRQRVKEHFFPIINMYVYCIWYVSQSRSNIFQCSKRKKKLWRKAAAVLFVYKYFHCIISWKEKPRIGSCFLNRYTPHLLYTCIRINVNKQNKIAVEVFHKHKIRYAHFPTTLQLFFALSFCAYTYYTYIVLRNILYITQTNRVYILCLFTVRRIGRGRKKKKN